MSKEFASLWIGPPPSIYELLSFKSYIDLGHKFTLYTYQNYNFEFDLPTKDASLVLEKPDEAMTHAARARFSDYFRYRLLRIAPDVIWVDTDMVCLSSVGFSKDFIFCKENRKIFSTSILAYPSDSNLAVRLDSLEGLENDKRWGAVGPLAFTREVKQQKLQDLSIETTLHYPIGLYELDLLFNPEKANEGRHRLKDSLTVHLWNGHIVKSGIPKNVNPPKGSLIRDLMEKHGVINPSFSTLDDSWVRSWAANYAFFSYLYQCSDYLGPIKPFLKRMMKI